MVLGNFFCNLFFKCLRNIFPNCTLSEYEPQISLKIFPKDLNKH